MHEVNNINTIKCPKHYKQVCCPLYFCITFQGEISRADGGIEAGTMEVDPVLMSHDMLRPPTPRTDKACACVKPVGTCRQEWNEFAAANNFASHIQRLVIFSCIFCNAS